MLARPSTIKINSRLIGFGMANVPENNWEAVMVTILHYLSMRMDYNKKLQKATHLIVDEAQIVSSKPGSADQLNNAVITFRKFGGIVTMAMQNVTAALSNPKLVELFQNCSYKCFFDQGGVDAQSLAAIQDLTAKEYQALGTGRVGEGVIVWNKKVLLFNARISEKNVLYETFNTNFHEKAKRANKKNTEKARENTKKEAVRSAEKQEKYDTVLQLAHMVSVTPADVSQILGMDQEAAHDLLKKMADENLLVQIGADDEKKYGKAG